MQIQMAGATKVARETSGGAMQAEVPVGSERVFDGRLIGVRVDTVRLPDGSLRQREVAEHPGAVAILPVLPEGEVVLVRQYRHAVGRTLLEVPAGTREPDERTDACARRELAEETGYRAGSLRELVRFYVSPGWANEELVVYVATDLTAGEARPEDDERLEVVPVRPEDVPPLIAAGEIGDAKTIVALTAYLGMRLEPGQPRTAE
ncbi:MAG TPA: NUDIX hydrolase [Thermomicrobiaceae bacterium]|nr:NUDIX hydrolase [Thermomicrobiaceae bacterium]